jgi:hypothetical protein
LDMAQHQKKVGILFELGEVQINRTRWPDYRQYGFGHDDIDALLELAVDLSLHGARVESNEVWAPLHLIRHMLQPVPLSGWKAGTAGRQRSQICHLRRLRPRLGPVPGCSPAVAEVHA